MEKGISMPEENSRLESSTAEESIAIEHDPVPGEQVSSDRTDTDLKIGKVALGAEKSISTLEHQNEVESLTTANSVSKKEKDQTPDSPTKGHRGHPMKQVKQHLAQAGKLNAKKPMPLEWKKRRRKKNR